MRDFQKIFIMIKQKYDFGNRGDSRNSKIVIS